MSQRSKLQRAAIEFVTAKGWKNGDTLSLHSVTLLMEQFAGLELMKAAQAAAKLLDGYDQGDSGFGVEEAIRSQMRPTTYTR